MALLLGPVKGLSVSRVLCCLYLPKFDCVGDVYAEAWRIRGSRNSCKLRPLMRYECYPSLGLCSTWPNSGDVCGPEPTSSLRLRVSGIEPSLWGHPQGSPVRVKHRALWISLERKRYFIRGKLWTAAVGKDGRRQDPYDQGSTSAEEFRAPALHLFPVLANTGN